MKLKVVIDCENDAFAELKGIEIARILRALAAELEPDAPSGYAATLMDANGNRVTAIGLVMPSLLGAMKDNA